MSKLGAFVRLDFLTIKPYFTWKNLLIYAVIAIYLTTFSFDLTSALGVGIMLGTMFVGYPFTLSEKSNMDALYATLSVSRKTVVLGRYVFTMLLNLSTVLFSMALGIVSLLVARALGSSVNITGSFGAALALASLFVLIQLMQLPMYFKLGYSKAKFLSLIPFTALMAGYFAFMPLRQGTSGFAGYLAGVFSGGLAIPLLVSGLTLIAFVSYRLSRLFYGKREF